MVRSLEVATANIRSAAELAAMLPGDLGKVYSDSAFGGSRSASAIRAKVDSLLWPEAVPGAEQYRCGNWRPIMPGSNLSNAGSRRCSGPGNTAMACAGCAGSALPRRDCRSASPPWPTICGALSPFYMPQRLDAGRVCPHHAQGSGRGDFRAHRGAQGAQSSQHRAMRPFWRIRAHISLRLSSINLLAKTTPALSITRPRTTLRRHRRDRSAPRLFSAFAD